MQQEHVDKFWGCFPNLPVQPAVGESPQVYLKELNQICGLSLAWPAAHPTGLLTRLQLRKLCRDAKVDVLIAYAAVMAWGGRGVNSRNYRLSISGDSRTALVAILKKLRASSSNREYDFGEMQNAAERIKGLGISFYTKLLFFFRSKSDAYILDQFTAKSANLLFVPCQVVLNSSNYPSPDSTPASYEWFCAATEALGGSRTPPPTWPGDVTERAMFDARGGAWRKYLRSIYGKAGPRKSKKAKGARPTPPAPPQVEGDSLPARVAKTHAAAYRAGWELPGATPRVGNSSPIRVHCSLIDGVTWQYAFHQNRIHAEVFIPAQHKFRYDKLCRFLGVKGNDFGDSIMGNGEANGKTRSLKVTMNQGLNAPHSQWDEIARQAVSAMTTLFGRVCEYL